MKRRKWIVRKSEMIYYWLFKKFKCDRCNKNTRGLRMDIGFNDVCKKCHKEYWGQWEDFSL